MGEDSPSCDVEGPFDDSPLNDVPDGIQILPDVNSNDLSSAVACICSGTQACSEAWMSCTDKLWKTDPAA